MAKEKKVNPFKELERSLLEVPPEMKKKVMSDIATAKLLIDMGRLYTRNYGSAMGSFFSAKRPKDKDQNKDKGN